MSHKHHLQFPRKLHDAHPDTRELRRNCWLIPPINEIGHIALHSEVILVPPLDRFTAGRVLKDFVPQKGDYIGSMYNLISSIDEALKHPKARAIEIENAQVAIHAIELQVPFIKEYLEI